jgi:hypothetical protein
MEAQFNELQQLHQKLIQSLQCEIWRNIDGYDYSVSNFGRIKSIKTGRILKQNKNKKGYLRVGLSKDGIKKTLKVHISRKCIYI